MEPFEKKSILGNIYVGKTEEIASNIRAAFIRFADGQKGYMPLSEGDRAIYTSGRKGNAPLRPGDELLVQVKRDAMKGKLPALTSDLNLTGKYFALTTGNKKIGFSAKLSKEEAALTAEALGNKVTRLYDVGVAGLHRLLAHTDDIMGASAIVAIAGMEGALASVIGGLADCPVIAVPTSVGYGASFGGLSALLSMLNSCASGVSVVNIDNGFGAGYLASMINHIGVK